MKISGRLVLAMAVLVATTACIVSVFAYFFVAGAPPQGALPAIIGAALAGGATTSVLALALANGLANRLRQPLLDVATFADVRSEPEQERAYQTLIDNEKMARAIIEEALDAFVQTDGSCVVLDWSPHAEALMGWTREEALGHSVEKLLFPESLWVGHRQWIDHFLSEAKGDAAGGRYETPLLRKDGSEFFAEVSLTALRRNEGFIINAFVRDITEKRAAQEQLFQAQKMESVGQLTGGIAHDFNNMLTVITGTIEILADGVKHDPALASIARMINDAADRASQLTANLLAFARKQPLRPLETDVNALIEETVKLLAPTLGRQIQIETALNDLAWPALVDRSQLTSALVNLAINARDAMPGGGTLLFKTGNYTRHADDAEIGDLGAGDYVTIEVIDSGAGIELAIRDKIFEPFFSTKQFGTGTGLGLSMVFGFAKQSGGAVIVDGEEGEGACFRIYLPKADAAPSDAPATADASAPYDEELPGGSETILCVEDDDVVRMHVAGRLRKPRLHRPHRLQCGRGARNGRCRRGIRPAVHRHRHARRHERPSARAKGRRAAPAAPGALHLGQYVRCLCQCASRRGRAAPEKTLSQGRTRAPGAPLAGARDRPHGRSDPAALFGAGRSRAFSEGKSAEGRIGRFRMTLGVMISPP